MADTTGQWATGGYEPGMLLVVTKNNRGPMNGTGVRLGLCMATSHAGDGFWYFAPVKRDGTRYKADLDHQFSGYAWADKSDVQPDQRQRYLLLAGESVELVGGGGA